MQPLKIRTLPFAAILLLSAPLAIQAADLSLPLNSWSQVSALEKPYDPNDPLVQLLAMEEVDVWARIRKGFGIPDLDNPLVANHVQWYVSRPDYIQRTTTRASRYLFHVVQELEKRGMPTELALLPFIESAFNPQALSTAKAAGMWQFIPSTGRDFNLTQSVFKDDRRNVIASTDAALTYLQKLYSMFGDWQLALAAYNWGEGSVQRAISKAQAAGRPTDFNSLSQYMPAETRNYVPKLQAVKNIIASPADFGVVLPKVENQPYFVTIGKTRDIDIKVAAQLAELSIDEFKALNPQFKRPVIAGSSETQILLPQSNAEKFKANLSKWGHALSSWTAHKVTSARERIETIAKKFGTTPEVIREANNIPPKMLLKAGSTVLVPKPEHAPEKDIAPELVDNATMVTVPDVPETRRVYVKVGKRDSLESIARRHKVSVSQIRSWNNLKHDKVAAGQTLELNLPNKASSNRRQAARGTPTRHKAAPAPARKTAGSSRKKRHG
ncbi:MAG TPA: transglycosylase SLT domain-containing protein [Noviherbaspirillum sp.]|uniref:transglycosylase SLT domain-containing protein n=1 Tax=Noviherbaspirillum sp. TaxID=1926288 RepID=UPI002B488C11|nr:transglycosylase SLT domain-containing protein [Noviherbaspirillum sp.]HJV85818.1 transglycosylase SLT domain-containing protein [Noviherbaspirillum sp.]